MRHIKSKRTTKKKKQKQETKVNSFVLSSLCYMSTKPSDSLEPVTALDRRDKPSDSNLTRYSSETPLESEVSKVSLFTCFLVQIC
jgi:hypothetical protein